MRRIGAVGLTAAVFSFAIYLCARVVVLCGLLAAHVPHAVALSGGIAVIGFSIGAGLILAVVRGRDSRNSAS